MAKQRTKAEIRAKIRWGIAGIFALLLITAIYDAPAVANRVFQKVNDVTHIGIPLVPEKPFALGLDLQGGAHLVYQANTDSLPDQERGPAVEGARDVIERRVNGLGIGEPSVQTSKIADEFRIVVELPGVTDVKEAISMIGETPILEFREENTEPPRELTKEEQDGIDEYNKEAKSRAQEVNGKARSGEDFAELAKEYSEDPHTKNNGGYVGFIPESISPEITAWAKNQRDGAITRTPIDTGDALHIVRRESEKKSENFISASHILICYLGARSCDSPLYTKQEAEAKAQELFEQANASNFESLAKEFSTEPGADASGGDLGTFGRGAMVPAFENAAFEAQEGQIVGPVETEFGYHVIYRKGSPTEYELSSIKIAKQTAADILPPADPWKVTELSGKQLERAEVVSDQTTGAVQVSLLFNAEGKQLFADLTQKHIGEPIAIFLDGEPISIPTVQTAITDGRAVITGNFTLVEARLLAQRLNAGALPVPVELISQQAIGATLGQESLSKSLTAGAVGIMLVMLFMLLYYRLPGLLSVISLSVYIALTLAVFKLIGVTLTLAGIAGFILSVGMAVDANVLIFERLKEELKDGKSLKAAVEEGFLRAWTSIRDGNVSTLITCIMLIGFGSSFVKGFAVTLFIGILFSMFSAITITRVMLRFVVPWFSEKANWLFLGAQK